MTLTELKERTDQKFEMIAVCHDTENILFAVPIPGAFHLHYTTTETGETVILDPMDDWMDAWEAYAAKLTIAIFRIYDKKGGEEKSRRARRRMQAG